MKRLVLMGLVATLIAAGGVALTSTSAFAATTICNSVLAGGAPTVTGDVVVPAGANCNIQGQTVTGNVSVNPGGTLIVGGGSTINGNLSSTGAGSTTSDPLGNGPQTYSILVCNSTVRGNVSITTSTSNVLIGDEEGCGGNTINGTVSLTSNKGGVELIGNTVGHSVSATSNTGKTHDDPSAVEISGNTISGVLSCTNNSAVEPDGGNTARFKSGQCAAL